MYTNIFQRYIHGGYTQMCTASTVKLSFSINCSASITNVPSLAVFESRSPGSVEQEHVLAIKMFDSQEPIKITKRSRWLQYYCINRIAVGMKRVRGNYSTKCNLVRCLLNLMNPETRHYSSIVLIYMRLIHRGICCTKTLTYL